MKYKNFLETGYENVGEIISKKECKRTYKLILDSRDWSSNLFRSEEEERNP